MSHLNGTMLQDFNSFVFYFFGVIVFFPTLFKSYTAGTTEPDLEIETFRCYYLTSQEIRTSPKQTRSKQGHLNYSQNLLVLINKYLP